MAERVRDELQKRDLKAAGGLDEPYEEPKSLRS